jgi:hypothetical protein
MIDITKNEGNIIYYECDCGTTGKCMIKPLDKSDAIVVHVTCPMCGGMERITLVQYSTDTEKISILNNINDVKLVGSLVLSNETIK